MSSQDSMRNLKLLLLLWTRFSWRHFRMAPVSSSLLLLIMAVGVGAFLSIRLANRAAVSGFENFADMLSVQSDGSLSAPAGSLPQSFLRKIREALGNEPVLLLPVLESTAAVPGNDSEKSHNPRRAFQLVGTDLLALVNVAAGRESARSLAGERRSDFLMQSTGEDSGGASRTLRGDNDVFISHQLAQSEKLQRGSILRLIINENVANLTVAGIVPDDPSRPAVPRSMLLMDLPVLQRLTERNGQLDRIELILEEGPRRAERWERVKSLINSLRNGNSETASFLISSPDDRRASAAAMTSAFELNLTILSLLALVVGLYMVFQALDGAVVRRREEIAILSSLGIGRAQIQMAWLVEAGVIGLIAGLLGIGFGAIGAQGAVRLVGRTVNSLYYATSADFAEVRPGEALAALALSVAAGMAAGWGPAHAAAITPPAQVLVRSGGSPYAGGPWLRRPWLGITIAAIGAILAMLPAVQFSGGSRFALASYIAAFCWVLGAGIFGGITMKAISRILSRLSVNHLSLRLALSQMRMPTGRHRLAVAALVCAIAMTAGMAILVSSFDETMHGWIARTFQADLFISSDGARSASSRNLITPLTWHSIVKDPSVDRANVMQMADIRFSYGTTRLCGTDLEFYRDFSNPAWTEAPLDNAVFDQSRNESLALVSESFSERFHLDRGDHLSIPTPSGSRELTIAGSFSDFGSERGTILVDRTHFARWFGDELATSIILSLRPGTNAENLRGELHTKYPGLSVLTNAELRTEVLRIFHQTFSITYALELIGVFVAVTGLGFTLASIFWERRNDLATLRALGFRRSEIATAGAWEAVLTAASGITIGLPVSLAEGWLLIHRVNKQTFGWTLQTHWPVAQLALLAVVVAGSAAVTGFFIGGWSGRLPAEREE